MRRRLLAAALAAVVVVVVVVLGAGGEETGPRPEPAARSAPPPRPAAPITHLRALQRLADRNDGNRAAGTPGGRASTRYVASRLRRAGYSVRLQRARFPFHEQRRRPRLAIGGVRLGGVSTPRFSRGGSVRGELRPVGLRPSGAAGERAAGCLASEFAGFPRGAVALIERGTCRLGRKVRNAARAGAAGAVIFNDGRLGRRGRIDGTLGRPTSAIPALFATHATGLRLAAAAGASVRMRVDVVSEMRTTHSIVAELPGRSREVAMAGAHIDSVAEGPGINDNGSGVSALLSAGEVLAGGRAPRRTLRLAFWGAEELGLIGSRRYVRRLSPADRRRIAGYLNLDMVGSGNGGRFVYYGRDARSAALARIARRALRRAGVSSRRGSLGGGSDHAPFARAGVPVAGLFAGASGVKNAGQRDMWGGRAGRPFDRCYHRRCDRLRRVDRRTLRELSGAALGTLRAMTRAG